MYVLFLEVWTSNIYSQKILRIEYTVIKSPCYIKDLLKLFLLFNWNFVSFEEALQTPISLVSDNYHFILLLIQYF
jgi:hypothetical protein